MPSRSARRGRSNAAASDLHREVDARQGAVVGQAAGLASGARCQSLRRGARRPHLPPAARSARRKRKPRVPAKVKGGREWSSNHDAGACGESWQAAGACAVRVGAARDWLCTVFAPGHAGPPHYERVCCDGVGCSGAHTWCCSRFWLVCCDLNNGCPSRVPLKWGHQDKYL